jgi:hypothetical protein
MSRSRLAGDGAAGRATPVERWWSQLASADVVGGGPSLGAGDLGGFGDVCEFGGD